MISALAIAAVVICALIIRVERRALRDDLALYPKPLLRLPVLVERRRRKR